MTNKKIKIVVLMLVYTVSLINPTAAAAAAAAASPPPFYRGPQYTIDCLENGDVKVTGVSTDSKPTLTSGNATCIKKNPSVINTHFIIKKDCLDPAQLTTGDRSVTFTIYDPSFDGKTARPTPTGTATVKNLEGGQNQHTITVTCTKLPNKGMHMHVVHGMHLETVTVKRPNGIGDVAMYLKADKYESRDDIMNLPDLTSVYIGDKFYLYLVYTGTEEYFVIPKKCAAFSKGYASEPSIDEDHVELWTDTSCVSAAAKDYRIMHNFKETTHVKQAVQAEMFGFRFSNTDEVTFVCDVVVCEGHNCGQTSKCTTTAWPERRRRSSNRITQDRVFKSIRMNNKSDPNRAGLHRISGVIVGIVYLSLKMI